MPERAALLLDGGFVKKKLESRHRRFPTAEDVTNLGGEILSKPRLHDSQLLRTYFYDAPPFEGESKNPIDGSRLILSNTPQAKRNRALIDTLELEPDFAVRRGVLALRGWKLGSSAMRRLSDGGGQVSAPDLVPDLSQKGVDIRIGLDIAALALKRVVDILVLVTGDSDFVAPMKFARKEGVRVYLDCLGHGVRRELKAHADFVL